MGKYKRKLLSGLIYLTCILIFALGVGYFWGIIGGAIGGVIGGQASDWIQEKLFGPDANLDPPEHPTQIAWEDDEEANKKMTSGGGSS